MTPQEFIRKWKDHALTERAAAHEHFLDLCRLFDHPTPAEEDPRGESFTFEKGVTKTGGGDGFADVWKRGHFAWEYKKRKRDLNVALEQLTRYAAALENPPLHVVCDTLRFRIETRWTNTVPKVYEIALEDLVEPEKRDILHAVFHDPLRLQPKRTRDALTREAADRFSGLAVSLQGRADPLDVAHFINQLVFCFFAEDVKLLPENLFTKALKQLAIRPRLAHDMLSDLFGAMAKGGRFGIEYLPEFNGNLFDGRPPVKLELAEIDLLVALTSLDWSQIDPTIFGTLFERFLDPDKRAQIGAHYTDAAKINLIIEPVILRPLRAEWEAARARIEDLLSGRVPPPKREGGRGSMKPEEAAEAVREAFMERLRGLRILDPACGSGNFLYLALQGVKDLELRANLEAQALGLPPRAPTVGPEILRGIEINPFAAELARATIWIGDIQWGIRNAFYGREPPILRRLDAIECRDALIERDEAGNWREAAWPEADFIVGNPPFLGGKKLRNGTPSRRKNKPGNSGLGDEYVNALFAVYDGRVPREADLVCYWFEKAWRQMQAGRLARAGFVATNSIRGGANRRVLDPIAAEGRIFEAWADEEWVLDGAAVRVSLVCFGNEEKEVRLNGEVVAAIHADLTGTVANLTGASRLKENNSIAFMGVTKSGPFDIDGSNARRMLLAPLNPNKRPNSDVLQPSLNGRQITGFPNDRWILNFDKFDSIDECALYEEPFLIVDNVVKPERQKSKTLSNRNRWWKYERPRPEFFSKISRVDRFLATSMVSKYRFFVFVESSILPENLIIAIARDDDTTFGILHSRFHEAWSLRLGTSLEDRPRYTPTTTFETFPFPEGLTPNIPAADYADDPRAVRIAQAARRLDELRNAWLYPADLGSWQPEIVPTAAPGEAPRRYPDRFVPKDTQAAMTLRERTLTNLYNQRPQWLASAHAELDRAVAAAYGWPEGIDIDDALANLLALNLERAAAGR